MANVVLGQFVTLLGDVTTTGYTGNTFMDAVNTTSYYSLIPFSVQLLTLRLSLYFVYIGIVRLVTTYLYASLFTHAANEIVRNIQHAYLRAAFSQEIGFYDKGTSGSISMQATSNGRLIQAGISEKLGILIQAISTFIGAFVIAFISQWKLTLIILCIVPAILIIVGVPASFDAVINTNLFSLYAQAASYAENILGGVRTVHAFNLGPRVSGKYSSFLDDALHHGMKKNKIMGVMFGGQYFVIYSGMGLAFWQGFAMIERGEVENLGTVFT